MAHFPIQLSVRGRRCVIIGGGSVAARKAASLAECGAQVVIVAPEMGDAVRKFTQAELVLEAYRAEHLNGAWLAFAATDSADVNAQVTRDAQAQGIFVCDVSAPEAGDFTSPSVVRRGDLTLTAATGGGSPTLAAVVKEELAQTFGPEWGALTAIVGRLRSAIQAAGDERARRETVRRIVGDKRVRELIGQERLLEAEARARECLYLLSE